MATREDLAASVSETVELFNTKACEAVTLGRIGDAVGYSEALEDTAAAFDCLDTGDED